MQDRDYQQSKLKNIVIIVYIFVFFSLKNTDMSSDAGNLHSTVTISPTKFQSPSTSPEKSKEEHSDTLSSEMMEIVVDMMVKYTFSSYLTHPKRFVR